MNKPAIWIGVLAALCVIFPGCISSAEPDDTTIYVIPVSGTVDPGMGSYIHRALDDIPKDPPGIAVLEIDTFGGRVDAALDIVQSLLDAAPRKTVAYVSTKAI